MNNHHIQIQDIQKCCGCRACANACPCDAITMKMDELGFFYPEINTEKCVDCGKCISVCDFSRTERSGKMPLTAYAAIHKDRAVLKDSSSGGVFSALAEYVLEQGGAVCGCLLEGLRAIHVCAETQDDVIRMRKSKYVQSDVGMIYRDVATRLKNGQMVLFTGTPCQVAALYEVLGHKDYPGLITLDLVCHGVPSELMFQKFIEYLEKKHKTRIVDFNFRSKKHGWQRSTLLFTGENGKVKYIGKANEFYYPAFSAGFITRPSCFSCKYACQERVADITVGDFWGHEKINLLSDTKNGVSICTLNTNRAKSLYSVLSERLCLQEIDYQIAVNGNHCLRAPTPKGDKWDLYMDHLKKDSVEQIAKLYIQKNKKKIIRNKLKLLVPYGLFMRIRKRKYK